MSNGIKLHEIAGVTLNEENDVTIGVVARTSDKVCNAIILSAQAPWASATGANRDSGDVRVAIPLAAAGGTPGSFDVTVGSNHVMTATDDLDGIGVDNISPLNGTEVVVHGQQFTKEWVKESDDALATDETSLCWFFINGDNPVEVTQVLWRSKGAVSVNATNYIIFSVVADDGASLVAELRTDTTSIDTNTNVDFGTITNATLAAGEALGLSIDKQAAGQILGRGVLSVRMRYV